jgi:hypothetical protein
MLSLLENLFPKTKKSRKTVKTAPGGAKDGQGTRLSSDWRTVSNRLAEIGASQVLLHGDRASFASAKAELPGKTLLWISHVMDDVKAGAAYAEDADWHAADAVVCVGAELPARYRQAIRLMAAHDVSKPVFWVGNGFEYCGGTLSAPQEVDEVEGLLFNHFQEFFGVKDTLQFRIEIYHGPEVKRFYRILEPNQSYVIRLSEHVKTRQYPVSLSAFVEHPILTRDRHYRLRLCADVFWRDSFTTLHSAHEFSRSPDHKVEFRAPAWLVRDGAMVLTIPNFELKATEAQDIEIIAGSVSSRAPRQANFYITQASIQRGNTAADQMLGWRYQGFGGSNWFALEDTGAVANGRHGSIAGNHHASCPVLDREDRQADAEEIGRYQAALDAGFVIEPHPVPVMPAGSAFSFGFDADSANPHQPNLRVDFLDDKGAHLGKISFTKTKPGPLFAEDLVALWPDPAAARAALILVSHDWVKGALRFKGFKSMVNLLIRHRQTGDQDVTEFQSCWRNLGTAVPNFPHWLTDQLGVVGRTNVFGRARCDKGLRTAVSMVNGSGRLNYHSNARVDVVVVNADGRKLQARVNVPAFTHVLVWLDELLPDLVHHLGAAGNGALLLQSGDADINSQIITTSPGGAISLQHLWGY